MTTWRPEAGRGGAPRRPARLGSVGLLLVALLLGVACLALLVGGFHAPLSYDESYNLQVAQHLAHEGRYATDGFLYDGAPRLFDAYITTGPTVLIPTGVLFAVLGEHLWVARLAPMLGFGLLLATSGIVGRRLAARWGAVAAVASVLAVDLSTTVPVSPLFGPGDVMGDLTCAGLVLAAGLCLGRPRRAGLLLGLAILTKVLALVVLPAFLVVLCLSPRARLSTSTRLVELSVWCAAPVVAWQVVRFAVLGPREFTGRNREFVVLLVSNGSPQGSGATGLGVRLGTLGGFLARPEAGRPLVALALVGGLVLALVSVMRAGLGEGPHRAPDETGARDLVACLSLGSLSLLSWWLLVPSAPYARHALLGLFIGLPVVVSATVRVVRAPRAGPVRVPLGAALALGLAVAIPVNVVGQWSPAWTTLDDQQEAAGFVRNSGATHIVARDWWQNPEIAFLSGVSAGRARGAGAVLVLDPVSRTLDPASYARLSTSCSHVVYRAGGYTVCEDR